MLKQRTLIALVLTLLLAGLMAPAGRAESPQTPLILVHGLLGSPKTTWAFAAQWLGSKGYVEGQNLFLVDLQSRNTEGNDLGVLDDAGYVAGEVRRILRQTGAAQADLVGNSRGGLVVRLVAEGETAPLIHRAVTIDAPHQGVMPAEKLQAMLDYAKVNVTMTLPADLQADSAALRTIAARESRFADRRAPALAIASTFRTGIAPILEGHDGFVDGNSQTAWPGAAVTAFKIGPTAQELQQILESGNQMAMIQGVPHVVAPDQEAIWTTVYDFLTATTVKAPTRNCEPNCQDYPLLAGHWSEATVRPMLPDLLPYDLDSAGNRSFDPKRPMTRAEFVYGLDKNTGLAEQLRPTAFTDLQGHWSLGYVEAAVAAKLVNGLSADTFGPDNPLTRAQAAKLIAAMKQYTLSDEPSRFTDVHGHWAEKYIEAAAQNGILKGDPDGRFRPDDQVTAAEAAVILSRAFPR